MAATLLSLSLLQQTKKQEGLREGTYLQALALVPIWVSFQALRSSDDLSSWACFKCVVIALLLLQPLPSSAPAQTALEL